MDLTKNSDDNHGIQGLLAILRAHQDEEYSPHRHEIPNQHQQQSRNPSAYQNPYGSSQSSSTKDPRAAHRAVSRTLSNSQSTSQDQDLELEEQNGPSKKKISTEELHSMSFAKALPILTKLAGDEVFLKEVMKLKELQDDLERDLLKERKKIIDSGDSSLNKPSLKTQGLLTRWAHKSLERWDNVTSQQQERLESLGVPCFFKTKEQAAIRKQERIFGVLLGLLE